MIAVFATTSNVYRPQWHPDAPAQARPGLLSTVSAVPTKRPEQSLAPWFEWSWRMGEPWLALKRPPLTVPGTVGFPIPAPRGPVSMKPWFQPDWTMDAQWQWDKIQDQTPPSIVTIQPPPTRTADASRLADLFPPWSLMSPWAVPAPRLVIDASVPPLRLPLGYRAKIFQPDWSMDAPWIWDILIEQTPSANLSVPPPPTRPQDASRIADLFPVWNLSSPWGAPPSRFLLDASIPPLRTSDVTRIADLFQAWKLSSPWSVPLPQLPIDTSVPPLRPPTTYRTKLFQPEWTMDSAWLWSTLLKQPPTSVVTILPPPTRTPDASRLADLFPLWSLTSPWSAPLGRLVISVVIVGTFQQIMVRGNRPDGKDDYIETWFG